MKLTVQKRLAAKAMKTSPKKVRVEPSMLSTVKESITSADVRTLISSGVITKKPSSSQSRSRARKKIEQKRKGRGKGTGRRRGGATARAPRKDQWMTKIRSQREFLRMLKEKNIITAKVHRALYNKCQGGYFRNVRHIKLYLEENDLAQQKQKTE